MDPWSPSNDQPYNQGYSSSGYTAQPPRPGKKSKWIAGLLSFFIPGTGYFYLGLMVKGIMVMLLFALNIVAITFAAMEMNNPLIVILLSLLLPIIYFYNLFDAIQSTDIVNAKNSHAGWAHPFYGMQGAPLPNAPVPSDAPQIPVSPRPEPAASPSGAEGDFDATRAHANAASGEPQQPYPPEPNHGPGGMPASFNTTGLIVFAVVIAIFLVASNMGSSSWLFRASGSTAGAIVLIGAGIGLWLWEMRRDRGRNG